MKEITRVEKMKQIKRENRKKIVLIGANLVMIFVTTASLTYGCVMSNKNDRIKEKIKNFNPDVKVFYLKQDIEKGDY